MRALLGYILALSLAAIPAMARTNGPDNGGSAPGANSASTKKAGATAKPETSSTESELEELRSLLESQASQLQEQNDRLKVTQEKIAALEKRLKAAGAIPSSDSAPTDSSTPAPAAAYNQPDSPPPTYGTNPALPEPQGASSPLSFRIGSAEFTPGGFMDLTNVFRTKDNGGSIGTSFSGLLYKIPANYPLAGSTEDKFSPQNSRLSLRVDSDVLGGKAVGYVETDFLGNAAASLNTTSNSATLRLRLYFIDYTRGHWEFLGGQDWSMLVSNRNGIGYMPGDIFYTQDMDTNYQLGLAWERTPQFRVVYHPNQDWAFGVSIEDPDQYIGSGVVTPSGASSVLNQFDPTTGTPNTPNVLPDIVIKGAYDHLISGHHVHVEAVGLARTFRLVNFTSSGTTATINGPREKVEGAAVAVNSNFEIVKNFRIFENAFWSDGGGRELANSGVPDFVIRPVNPNSTTGPYTLSPLHSGSFIGGFEYQATPKWLFYGYGSGVYVSKDAGETISGTGPSEVIAPYGWGIPTTSVSVAEPQNRFLWEATAGVIYTMWRNPQYGALQLITQASYVERDPWVVVPNSPHVAQDMMAWVDVRYTLP